MGTRGRLRTLADRALTVQLAVTLLGASIAFGGNVWWAGPALAALTTAMVATLIVRNALDGGWRVHRSPLGLLAILALGLGVAQLAPWPAALGKKVSARAIEARQAGLLADRALADDPTATLPDPSAGSAALTLDRSATLRWLGGGAACLALFVVAAHYSDRLGHSLVIWWSVVAALFVATTFGLVQVAGRADGLYGFLTPGDGVAWAPSKADLIDAGGATAIEEVVDHEGRGTGMAARRPGTLSAIGGLIGGRQSYLALGAIALPLALGLTLQQVAPRGSRQGLAARLADGGSLPLLSLVALLTIASAALSGLIAGPVFCVPLGIGMLVAGLPAGRATGLRWTALIATAVALGALGGGAYASRHVDRSEGKATLVASGADAWPEAAAAWGRAIRVARDFPISGVGLGSYDAIEPYYRAGHPSAGDTISSVARWWAEAGVLGLALLAAGALWAAWRLPGAIARVGTADRAMAFGLVGSVTGFALLSAVQGTLGLAAVALAASAVAGTIGRWLAGGTDLFVERA